MGWGYCGRDSKGRLIGYCHKGTCDLPECDEKIDRGLSYACGGMHGTNTALNILDVCEKYFCHKHLVAVEIDGESISVCAACLSNLIKSGDVAE